MEKYAKKLERLNAQKLKRELELDVKNRSYQRILSQIAELEKRIENGIFPVNNPEKFPKNFVKKETLNLPIEEKQEEISEKTEIDSSFLANIFN